MNTDHNEMARFDPCSSVSICGSTLFVQALRQSRHDPITTIRQMRSFAAEASGLVAGKSRAAVEADRVLVLALTRLLELVGKAATRVPQDVRDRHPHVPWRDVISLRNRLIHGYDTINFALLWQIVQRDVPPLVRDLDVILDAGVT